MTARPESEPPREPDEGAEQAVVRIASEPPHALAPEWMALHSRSAAATPFNHPAWHQAWLRHYGSECAPVFLAVRDGGDLVGVVVVDAGPDSVRLLGDHEVCDYAGPPIADGRGREVVEALLDWLDADLTSDAVFWGQREGDEFLAALRTAAPLNGWTVAEEHEANSPAVRLSGSWDDYLASLSKHDRHELRRKLRKLEEAGTVTYRTIADVSTVVAAMPAFLDMMRASREVKAAFLTADREAFFMDLGPAFAATGLMRLGLLAVDGVDVAMLFTFEDAETVYLYNSGYDPAYRTVSAGLLSKAFALRDAIGRGKRTFDFLRGDEAYKRHLGGQPREVVRVRIRR